MKLKNILFIVFSLTTLAAAFAQPLRSTRPEFSLKVAEESLAKNDYYNALEWYEKYYEQTKDRTVGYQIALLQMQLRDYSKAESAFSRVLQRDKKATGEVNPDARFFFAQMQKMNEKYEEAVITFEDYIKESKDDNKIALAKTEIVGAKMAMRMKENLTLEIEIGGHVCCFNDMPLSVLRAQTVFKYLKKKGIDESRMTYKGYSRNKPVIEDDRHEADARVNRRVEITVLKK